jgi:hypothetical protein
MEHVIACQDQLMKAIDARDVDGIEAATMALRDANTAMKALSVVHSSDIERRKVEHALKQSDALKYRVNMLTDWTRQRIDRLSELRGQPSAQTYTSHGKQTTL